MYKPLPDPGGRGPPQDFPPPQKSDGKYTQTGAKTLINIKETIDFRKFSLAILVLGGGKSWKRLENHWLNSVLGVMANHADADVWGGKTWKPL